MRDLPAPTSRSLRMGFAFLQALAGFAGLFFGFDFGYRIGGTPVGVLAGLNTAVFGVLMVSGLDDLVARWRGPARR